MPKKKLDEKNNILNEESTMPTPRATPLNSNVHSWPELPETETVEIERPERPGITPGERKYLLKRQMQIPLPKEEKLDEWHIHKPTEEEIKIKIEEQKVADKEEWRLKFEELNKLEEAAEKEQRKLDELKRQEDLRLKPQRDAETRAQWIVLRDLSLKNLPEKFRLEEEQRFQREDEIARRSTLTASEILKEEKEEEARDAAERERQKQQEQAAAAKIQEEQRKRDELKEEQRQLAKEILLQKESLNRIEEDIKKKNRKSE